MVGESLAPPLVACSRDIRRLRFGREILSGRVGVVGPSSKPLGDASLLMVTWRVCPSASLAERSRASRGGLDKAL
jgi:hypothetical protein